MGGVACTYLHINLEGKCWVLSAGINQFQWKSSDRKLLILLPPFFAVGRHSFAVRKIFFKSHHGVKKKSRPENYLQSACVHDEMNHSMMGEVRLSRVSGARGIQSPLDSLEQEWLAHSL